MRSSRYHEDTRPWHKEPWPWILMAGPAIVAVGCLVTIYLAFTHYDKPLTGGAVRQGLKVIPISELQASTDTKQVEAPKAKDPS